MASWKKIITSGSHAHLNEVTASAMSASTISVKTLTVTGSGTITTDSLTFVGEQNLAVADGGTGASTFTSNGILYGNGTGALQATAAGTNGYFLYSNSGTPAWTNSIDGGTY